MTNMVYLDDLYQVYLWEVGILFWNHCHVFNPLLRA